MAGENIVKRDALFFGSEYEPKKRYNILPKKRVEPIIKRVWYHMDDMCSVYSHYSPNIGKNVQTPNRIIYGGE